MNTIRPIRDFNSYSMPMAREIFSIIAKTFLEPLERIAKDEDPELQNALGDVLAMALKRGTIQYADGIFYGKFTASISKELRSLGAKFNKIKKGYALDVMSLPPQIQQAISEMNRYNREKVERVQDFMTKLESKPITGKDLEPFFGNILGQLEKQFYITTRPVRASDLEIPIREQYYKQLREDYTTNLNYYIKKWRDEQILRLRQKVEQNVASGFRAEQLIDDIQQERRMTKNKARFLAKQETSLMTAAYREIRYEEIGIKEYIWSTSHDERVRPTAWTTGKARANNHRILDGRKFRFDQPPIVDSIKGRRANPGCDFGCRCVAIPYISGGVNMVTPKPEEAAV